MEKLCSLVNVRKKYLYGDKFHAIDTCCTNTSECFISVLDIGEYLTAVDTLSYEHSFYHIQIDCRNELYGHSFCLFKYRDEWYMISSYIYTYPTRIDKIDKDLFQSLLLGDYTLWPILFLYDEGILSSEWNVYIYTYGDSLDERIDYLLSL